MKEQERMRSLVEGIKVMAAVAEQDMESLSIRASGLKSMLNTLVNHPNFPEAFGMSRKADLMRVLAEMEEEE